MKIGLSGECCDALLPNFLNVKIVNPGNEKLTLLPTRIIECTIEEARLLLAERHCDDCAFRLGAVLKYELR
ncbi:MAG TPA: hypothetical protein VGA73_06175 [Candidatus Binatia bacterium]